MKFTMQEDQVMLLLKETFPLVIIQGKVQLIATTVVVSQIELHIKFAY